MKLIGFVIIFAVAWAVGSSGSGAAFAAQIIDPFGPWGRVVAAVMAAAVGAVLAGTGNVLGVMLGAALMGGALSLWVPMGQFVQWGPLRLGR